MTSRAQVLVLAVLAATVARCGEAPTEPRTATPVPRTPPGNIRTPTPGPTPAPPDLNGEWSGTFKGGSCDIPEPVRMTIHQDGDLVYAPFEMSCFATNGSGTRYVELTRGSAGYFWLDVNDQHACLLSGAHLSSTTIHLWSRSSNLCVGAELKLSR